LFIRDLPSSDELRLFSAGRAGEATATVLTLSRSDRMMWGVALPFRGGAAEVLMVLALRVALPVLVWVAWLLARLPGQAQDPRTGEQKALVSIERLGGQFRRDEKVPGQPVVEVDLAVTKVTDEDLALLANLPGLRRLDLTLTPITDKGLERLKGLPGLEELTLVCPDITKKGVEQLQGMAGLRRLVLHGIELSEEEEKRLRRALPQAKIDLGNGNRAQKRVRKHFAIPDKTPLTEATIREAILAGLPAGSSEKRVYGFLNKCGIGKDEFSSFYPLKRGKIVCRIEFDPGTGDTVHTHYGIFFRMDADKGLQDVEVQEWYTGP
jgi:hypothetical protein